MNDLQSNKFLDREIEMQKPLHRSVGRFVVDILG